MYRVAQNHLLDRILVKKIAIFAYHGLYEEEARLGQRFNISLDCWLDLTAAGLDDDIAKGLSYVNLVRIVQDIAVGERFYIIEALGERIASAILRQQPLVEAISVTVEKPAAAIAAVFETIEVTIHRSRPR